MNVEIGAEAALFPEKENIWGILLAVYASCQDIRHLQGLVKQDSSCQGHHYKET
jgi:hypothetical protein